METLEAFRRLMHEKFGIDIAPPDEDIMIPATTIHGSSSRTLYVVASDGAIPGAPPADSSIPCERMFFGIDRSALALPVQKARPGGYALETIAIDEGNGLALLYDSHQDSNIYVAMAYGTPDSVEIAGVQAPFIFE